ncbi:FbpB family small basic protein [Alkalihalobacillus hemicellulosilyticus]|nr:FbpB family small basic protein [Halalkalibacter hemicellulosilyticus]
MKRRKKPSLANLIHENRLQLLNNPKELERIEKRWEEKRALNHLDI